MGKRRQAREYCIQALYLAESGNMSAPEILAALDPHYPLDEETLAFAHQLFRGTADKAAELDPIISAYAQNWAIGRMSVVDRCILRLAAYEIIYSTEVPLPAVLDEAIELGKKFSTENSGRFLNGVLDRLKEKRAAV